MNIPFFKKKSSESEGSIPSEMYRSVHVMQDDIDELHGKTPEIKQVSNEEKRSGNPFLSDEPISSEINVEKIKEAIERKPVENEKVEEKEVPKPFDSSKKEQPQKPIPPVAASNRENKLLTKNPYVLFGGIGVIVILVLGVGIYFFWINRDRGEEVPLTDDVPEILPIDEEMPVENPLQQPSTEYYSVENPNYLPVDIESTDGTKDGVRRILGEAAAKVKEMGKSDAIEFVVVDRNNYPIAFSRFAYILGLAVPEEVLVLSGERFSIYMILEGDVVRYGIAIDSIDVNLMKSEAMQTEKALFSSFSSILYGDQVVIPDAVSFHIGAYGALETRYFNFDDEIGTSFDYVFLENQMIIGTSKETFRTILAKIVLTPPQK